MTRPAFQVADVLNRQRDELATYTSNSWQLRTLHAIRKCRTAALGGHIDQCNNPDCHKLHLSYNSCRNRHCPKCQGHKREAWIRAPEDELLNVPYYHLVFTLPEAINPLCLYNPGRVYNILFKTAWSVIKDFGTNPKFIGGRTGMTAILHTWGQNLSLHPHLHCIVPGGGMTQSGKWKHAVKQEKYLFPADALSNVFRARYVDQLRKHFDQPKCFYDKLFEKEWVVYCKRSFFGPTQVVEYLGRYTHKIAISNHRILSLDDQKVIFTAKDYRKGGQQYIVKLTDQEFIRRFALHILPKGFMRIRHYGILSSTVKQIILKPLQEEVGIPLLPERPPVQHNVCPVCHKGQLITIYFFDKRGPPLQLTEQIKNQSFNIVQERI